MLGSAVLAAAWLGAQEFQSEMIPTALVENGVPIRLELVVSKPVGAGPFPTVMFNHGSTGTGSNPSEFAVTWTSQKAAKFFNERGWMVVFPQRRGRGLSDGLYDEGFAPDRSGYSCDPRYSLPGLERAMTDLDQVVAYLRTRTDVRIDRMLIGGHSRGGILSVVYAGTRPGIFQGVVNFVGGWMSDQCANPGAINTVSFVRGAAFAGPTIWLYGENDSYYRLAHSRGNFDAFQAAGGNGEFHSYTLPAGQNGHFLLGFPELWEATLASFVAALPGQPPRVAMRGGQRSLPVGGDATLEVETDSVSTPRWFRDGRSLTEAGGRTLEIGNLQPTEVGLYHATLAEADSVTEVLPAIVGLGTTEKVLGDGHEVGPDITHPNGRIYDQLLLDGAAATMTADSGQIARMSFLDLNGDIVQVEFAGAGALTLRLDEAAGPITPANYVQLGVVYMQGHAGIVITDADETTNVSVFSVGRANAVNQGLFREGVVYDGVADIAYIAIQSDSGRFGGLRTANVAYFADRGFTGVYAPGVRFAGPVFVGEIEAHDQAVPLLLLGQAEDIRITGGDLRQANGRAVLIDGMERLRFVEGQTSHGAGLPAQGNQGRFERAGTDVTAEIAIDP